MKLNKKIVYGIACCFMISGCKNNSGKLPEFSNSDISKVISNMTDVMVHDVTNPPLASRFFSYACLAGYEVVSQNDTVYPGMYGKLKNYPQLKKPDSIIGYSYQLSALLAMLETAKRMQPSGKLLEVYEQHLLDSCKSLGYPDERITASKRYANAVSMQILSYAKADGYNKISNFPRYTPVEGEGFWYPTPPAYMSAVEPYFNTVRPFTLDTCSQFKPIPPIAFSTSKHSAFYQLMLQNYSDSLTEEHQLIAAFWDCNPFALQDNGHLLTAVKKISPGAHWLGITGIACKQANTSFNQSMRILTTTSLGLMDGFIGCWDEKFRSNRIRPETAIRKYINPNWMPFLQTPPFPEYISGHSTISATSATILTHFFGENFSYEDTVELRFGLPSRRFPSFKAAAREAALSRFYGGIHFMDAIDNGMVQGEKTGEWVLRKMAAR